MCGQYFQSRTFLDRHYEIHDRQYRSEEFPEKPTGKPLPGKKTSGQKKNRCAVCGKTFKRKNGLQCHSVIHLNKSFKCGKCGKLLKAKRVHRCEPKRENPGQARRSVRPKLERPAKANRTGYVTHRCEKCGKFLPASCGSRIPAHTENEPFERYVCRKCTHATELKHKCETCGRGFARADRLECHILTHASAESHPCRICGRVFSYAYVLRSRESYRNQVRDYKFTHQTIHTDEKRYACDTCGSFFKRKSSLRKHIKMHQGGKPHRKGTSRV